MNVNINKSIIETVFQALLENTNPDSELHLEYEVLSRHIGPFAIQRKGNKIIESFPWPIGKELSTLFSSSYNQRDEKRVLKIFQITERIALFIAFCWLVQIWDTKRLNPGLELSTDFKAQFKKIKKPSAGTYVGMIRAISNILFDAPSSYPFLFRSTGIKKNTDRVLTGLGKLIVFRNKVIHNKEEIFCEDAEEILADILVSAAFLVNYPMVSVKNINVSKPKLSEAKYVHVFDHLNSQRPEFLGGRIELEDFSESNSVLLIENMQSMGTYINLSPFIINTEPFIAARGRSTVLPGLYIYSDMSGELVKYSYVNESGNHFLKDMPQHEIFERQWNNLKSVLA